MKIGVPCETKILEGRVALSPDAIKVLVEHGHPVFIEENAGLLSGYSNLEYQNAGAVLLDSAKAVYDEAELLVKVKEPQPVELEYLRQDHVLFCFLHLAAAPDLTRSLLEIGLTAVAFETVTHNQKLPLLAPMSDIAGKIAVQTGATLLHQPQGGRGILLGGVQGSDVGEVVIIGGGVAGTGAAKVASALGASITIFDPSPTKQEQLKKLGANVTTLPPSEHAISKAVKRADLVVGSVLVPGAKSPHLVSADQVKSMKSGTVIIDISVDQGGCIETTHPTTYQDPTYLWEGVIHFGVTNMPGAVPRTATQALSAAILPYVLQICAENWRQGPDLSSGINVQNGEVMLASLI